MLFAGECCTIAAYANATSVLCKQCDDMVALRLNSRVLGQVMDETGCVSGGKLLLSDDAWVDLLGRPPSDLLKLSGEGVKYLAERLLFVRVFRF